MLMLRTSKEPKRDDRTKTWTKIQRPIKMIGTIVNTNKHHMADNGIALNQMPTNYLGFTYHMQKSDGNDRHSDHADIAINLNNIAKVFLITFVEYPKVRLKIPLMIIL